MRRSCKLLLAFLLLVTFVDLFKFWCSEDYRDWVEAEQDEIDLKSVFKRFDTQDVFTRWHTCITENLLWIDDPEKFWDDFMFASKRCDLRAKVQQIGIVTLKNSDEMKHVIFPKIYNFGPHNLFSIGIGRDIQAERQFRRKMKKLGNNVTFYGADPVSYINDDLYSQIGTYFPLAIGAHSGISNAMVMIEDGGYSKKSMIHVDILYFFKNLLNVTRIDNMWFDAEGAEFGDGFFDIFYRNGRFDQNGIDICQINIEMHKHQDYPERKTQFMEFVKRLIREKRFGIFAGDQYIHNRIFWSPGRNDSTCKSKNSSISEFTASNYCFGEKNKSQRREEMIKNDNANQNQPFVLNSTLGDFLHSVAFFFMCVSLGVAVFGPISYSNNQLVIGFLLEAMFIHTLLAINSRLFFSISAFLTFGSVLLQLFAFFFFMFTTEGFNSLPLGHFLVVMFCVLFIVTVIITVQVFCSAALLKLSIWEDPPKPAKKSKKSRKHATKNRKHSVKSGTKSGDSTTKSENSVIPSTNSCSHTPTCSTRFSSISSMDNSSKIV